MNNPAEQNVQPDASARETARHETGGDRPPDCAARGLDLAAPDGHGVRLLSGETLEQRAQLVLSTLGQTPEEVRRAYRRLAHRHHPDHGQGDAEMFHLVQEAYRLLDGHPLPRAPLLADDALLSRVLGRRVEPLLDSQKAWSEYEAWRRAHFYDAGVF